MSNKLVVVDTETGGLDSNVHSILTLGAALLDDGEVKAQFHAHILEDPFVATPEALRVNGLTEAEIRDHGMTPGYAVTAFEEWLRENEVIGKATLAGHNIAGFDMGFLRRLYRLAGRRWPFDYHCLDTMSVALFLKHMGILTVPNVKLDTLCHHYGIEIRKLGSAHNAAEDAAATAKLLTALKKEIVLEIVMNIPPLFLMSGPDIKEGGGSPA